MQIMNGFPMPLPMTMAHQFPMPMLHQLHMLPQQMPMQQMPMQQTSMQQTPMQQMPMQQMPMLQQMPMQQVSMAWKDEVPMAMNNLMQQQQMMVPPMNHPKKHQVNDPMKQVNDFMNHQMNDPMKHQVNLAKSISEEDKKPSPSVPPRTMSSMVMFNDCNLRQNLFQLLGLF